MEKQHITHTPKRVEVILYPEETLLGKHTDSITHEHIKPPKQEKNTMKPDDIETDSIR